MFNSFFIALLRVRVLVRITVMRFVSAKMALLAAVCVMAATQECRALAVIPQDDATVWMGNECIAGSQIEKLKHLPVAQLLIINQRREKWPFTPLPERNKPPPLWCDNAEPAGIAGTCTHPNSSAADSNKLAEGHKAARVWIV